MKKFTVLLLAVICMTFLGYGSSVHAKKANSELVNKFGEQYLDKAKDSIDNHKVIMNELKELAKQEKSLSELPNDYAGAYINSNGDLVVSFSNNEAKYNFQSKLNGIFRSNENSKLAQVIFNVQDHAYDELENVYEFLIDNIKKFNIVSVAIVQKSNSIEVSIPEDADIDLILNSLQANISEFDQSFVKFIYAESYAPQVAYTVYGGRQIYYKFGLFNMLTAESTLSFTAYDYINKKFGVVTNSHAAPDGEDMRYENGQIIGRVSKRVEGGKVDAAFIPFTNTTKTTWNYSYEVSWGSSYTYLSAIADSTIIIEGAPTFKVGIASGYTTGTITSASFTTTVGTTYFTDVVQYSNLSLSGDSGAPVWIAYGSRGATHYLTAVHFAGTADGSSGLGCKVYNVMSALSIAPITLSNYYSI